MIRNHDQNFDAPSNFEKIQTKLLNSQSIAIDHMSRKQYFFWHGRAY